MYIHEYIYNLQDIVNYSQVSTTTHYIVTCLLDIRKSLFPCKLFYAASMKVILIRFHLNLFAVMAKFTFLYSLKRFFSLPLPIAIFETCLWYYHRYYNNSYSIYVVIVIVSMVLRHILPGYSVRRLNL